MIEKAKEDYLKGMKYKDLAKKYDVSINTVKSWVSRNGWAKLKKGCTQNKKGAYKRKSKEKKNKIEYEEEIQELEDADLTDKQRLFCIYQVKYFNATKAYKKAYDCSYNTAMVNGFNLLRNTKINEEIDRLKKNKFNRAMLSEDDVFQKYIDIAFSDITDYVDYGVEDVPVKDNDTGKQLLDDEGNPVFYKRNYVLFKDGQEVDGTLISEVSKGKDGIKIKLQDKMKALQWLTDRMDLLSTQVQKQLGISETENYNEAIKDFLKATKPTKEELEELFEGEDDEEV